MKSFIIFSQWILFTLGTRNVFFHQQPIFQISKFLLGGVQPLQSNLLRGLEFSIMNLTSAMFRGMENPTVSGMKRNRIPVAIMRIKQMS